MSKMSHLISDHISVQSCVTDVLSQIDEIDEIYLVYRRKDTNRYYENMSGDVKGLLFAILIMQAYANNHLDGKN